MAVVINGSGTVTGLAVGGLPDGTVDAGTLATDSVTSAKITDGAITNADINASAAIAASKLSGRYFYGYITGSNQSISSNVRTKVNLGGAVQSHSAFNTTTSTWTATAEDAGDWMFHLQISFYADGNNMDNPIVNLMRNGSIDAGGYQWVYTGTDQVRHITVTTQQVRSIASEDTVQLFGKTTGSSLYFFVGDSDAGYKQCSIMGVKL